MWRRIKRWGIAGVLVALGIAPVAQAQDAFGTGPNICPLFDSFLTPTFLDLIYPGLSTHL